MRKSNLTEKRFAMATKWIWMLMSVTVMSVFWKPPSDAQEEKPRLTGVRLVSSESSTRVMLEVSREVRYESHRLPADPVKGLPPRLYIDIFGARLGMETKEPIKVQDGLINQIRVGQFSQDVVRAVLDLTSVRDHNVFPLMDPYRVVIDI